MLGVYEALLRVYKALLGVYAANVDLLDVVVVDLYWLEVDVVYTVLVGLAANPKNISIEKVRNKARYVDCLESLGCHDYPFNTKIYATLVTSLTLA